MRKSRVLRINKGVFCETQGAPYTFHNLFILREI